VLDVAAERFAKLRATLSADERTRAAAFRRDILTHRFVAGRGILREILGAYLGLAAASLEFEYDANRKPFITPRLLDVPLQFNLAHAEGLALYAIANGPKLGIDLETVVSFPDMIAIAQRFFSADEQTELAAVDEPQRVRAFYCCWTRKEAYLKARGSGLMSRLDSFDISVRCDEPPALRRDEMDPSAPDHWALVHLEPAPDFVGALAVAQPGLRVSFWSWTG